MELHKACSFAHVNGIDVTAPHCLHTIPCVSACLGLLTEETVLPATSHVCDAVAQLIRGADASLWHRLLSCLLPDRVVLTRRAKNVQLLVGVAIPFPGGSWQIAAFTDQELLLLKIGRNSPWQFAATTNRCTTTTWWRDGQLGHMNAAGWRGPHHPYCCSSSVLALALPLFSFLLVLSCQQIPSRAEYLLTER